MEAEQLNSISNKLDDLAQRAAEVDDLMDKLAGER